MEDFSGAEHVKDRIWLNRQTIKNGTNRTIFRYMSFEHLLSMLSKEELYISNRKYFTDRREIGEIFDLKTDITFSIQERNLRKHEAKLLKNRSIKEAAKSVCISCWTFDLNNYSNKRGEENYLMWKVYNKGITCRIQTTIDKLINAIKPEHGYDILLSDVSYSNVKLDSADNYVFNKSIYYWGEQEMRMCVLSNEDHVILNINPFSMIEGIVLSPFITKDFSDLLINGLKLRYPNMNTPIYRSKIIENQI